MARNSKEEARETRERILDAAIQVFHEHGVARPSLSEIAKLAGVTRGAVYGHFTNKADLFNTLCDRIRLPAEALCDDISRRNQDNPLGELRERWLALFREVDENRDWQRIMEIVFHRCELVTESGAIRERMLQGRTNGDQQIQVLLDRAIAMNQLPATLDTRVAAALIHASLIGVLEDWVLQPRDYTLAGTGIRFFDALITMLKLGPDLSDRPASSGQDQTGQGMPENY